MPRILITLVTAVKDLNGLNTEGIFRISHNHTELAAMRKAFDSGVYTVTSTSPHAPAALLKEWLRDLSEALVAPEVYPDAIAVAKSSSQPLVPADKILDSVFGKLDPLAQRVMRIVAELCVDIAENHRINRMTFDNLAIVFAPSFFRCPSEDPMELLSNSKHETKLTASLIVALGGARAQAVLAAAAATPPAAATMLNSSNGPANGAVNIGAAGGLAMFANGGGAAQQVKPPTATGPPPMLGASSSANSSNNIIISGARRAPPPPMSAQQQQQNLSSGSSGSGGNVSDILGLGVPSPSVSSERRPSTASIPPPPPPAAAASASAATPGNSLRVPPPPPPPPTSGLSSAASSSRVPPPLPTHLALNKDTFAPLNE